MLKICKRCGVERPEDEFRQYYNGKPGSYTYCKKCESIEQRRKYLVNKAEKTEDELEELDKINQLYSLRAAAGLVVPVRRKRGGVAAIVDEMIKDLV